MGSVPAATVQAVPHVSEPEPEPVFDVVFLVLLPDKIVRGRGRGVRKAERVSPLSFGPIEIPFSLPWDEFLLSVVNAIDGCRDPTQLITSSFTWHFSSPVKGIRLGLKNEAHLFHLIKQVKLLKVSATAAQRLVVLEMDPPHKVAAALVSLPRTSLVCVSSTH
jgi:hypothetical protein